MGLCVSEYSRPPQRQSPKHVPRRSKARGSEGTAVDRAELSQFHLYRKDN